MEIAIALFDRFTALDAIGPYEVLQRLPEATVTFVGERTGEYRTENGFLGVVADATFDEVPSPTVIVVPGGIGTRNLLASSHPIHAWLQNAHQTTRFTTSVCTGSMVLAAAGLVTGQSVATHWSTYQELEELGATPTKDRIVELLDQRILTAAGVSAGIDMALRLAELMVDETAARAMQLIIEYDPQPPFDSGSFENRTPAVMRRVAEYSANKD